MKLYRRELVYLEFLNTYLVLILLFIFVTLCFFVVVLVATNEKFRDRLSEILPFSPKKGAKQPSIFVVILIIIGAMVIAYFF